MSSTRKLGRRTARSSKLSLTLIWPSARLDAAETGHPDARLEVAEQLPDELAEVDPRRGDKVEDQLAAVPVQ